MELNKIGIHVKKDTANALSKLAGIVTKTNGVKASEIVYSHNQTRKTTLDLEYNKNQAFMLISKLQNC